MLPVNSEDWAIFPPQFALLEVTKGTIMAGAVPLAKATGMLWAERTVRGAGIARVNA